MPQQPQQPQQATKFAEWLRNTAIALGYTTNTSLARALGVPQPTVSRWKAGAKPSVEHLVKISGLFGVELKSLLVLAGYVEAALPGSEELRPPASTRAGAMIEAADLTVEQKEAVRRFWQERLTEEQNRLGQVLFLAEKAASGAAPRVALEGALSECTASEVAGHLHRFLHRLMDALPDREVGPDLDAGVPDPDTGWLRPPEDIGTPLPESFVIQLSVPDPDARLLLVTDEGVPLAWTRAYPTQAEALQEGRRLLDRLPQVWPPDPEEGRE